MVFFVFLHWVHVLEFLVPEALRPTHPRNLGADVRRPEDDNGRLWRRHGPRADGLSGHELFPHPRPGAHQ